MSSFSSPGLLVCTGLSIGMTEDVALGEPVEDEAWWNQTPSSTTGYSS